MKREDVTTEQALAFWDALTGWTREEHGHRQGERKSPHAATHLLAAGAHAYCEEFSPTQQTDRTKAFLDYLRAVHDRLRPEGWGRCATCGTWGTVLVDGQGRCHSLRWFSLDANITAELENDGMIHDAQVAEPALWTNPDFGPCPFWTAKDGDAL